MKTYNAPQAQVVNFDNDYVAVAPSPATSVAATTKSISPLNEVKDD